MTVPLILFILPVLFIVILGPAACSINDALLIAGYYFPAHAGAADTRRTSDRRERFSPRNDSEEEACTSRPDQWLILLLAFVLGLVLGMPCSPARNEGPLCEEVTRVEELERENERLKRGSTPSVTAHRRDTASELASAGASARDESPGRSAAPRGRNATNATGGARSRPFRSAACAAASRAIGTR
jgi:hypothetical protein